MSFNIVYLIGNGFDLSKGLPTDYDSFYKYYCSNNNDDCKNSEITELKNSIKNKIINWSDLELALGKYIANLEKKEDLIKIHKDLRLNLIKYLKLVEANYNGDDSHKNKLFEDLREPEKYLPAIDHNKINVYRKELIKKVFDNNNRKGLTVKNVIFNQRWNTTVILFNYTNTFQRLTGFTNSRHIGNNDGNDIYHNILKFRKYLRQL